MQVTTIYYWGRPVDKIYHISYATISTIGFILVIFGLNLILGNYKPVEAHDIIDPTAVSIKDVKYDKPKLPNTSNQRSSSVEEVERYVCNPKFKWDCEDAKKIIFAESSNNPRAIHKNKNGSVDRGIWQINSKYHPKVTDTCAFSPECATDYAHKLYLARGWSPWYAARALGL